ncbi:MAG: glycosyltransferase family 39 protein [Anaerolineae bacterium]|nr:glycosyltransferase family 39 protein [Anaerolineae bacterium]
MILLGIGLRIHALAQDIRLQPDEAWFSTFARAAALNGDWWLSGPLDKPPLAIYANALAQVLVGDSEFAARLPGTVASIVLLPVMAAAAAAWYTPPAVKHRAFSLPLMVLILTAFSPYALAFSATAYTDALMLLGLGCALWLAGRSRWTWSGMWLGVGFASKPQALFYFPLLLALGWAAGRLTLRQTRQFLMGLLGVGLSVLLWDAIRPGDSLFVLAAAHNDPSRWIRASEIIPRLQAWLVEGQALLGPGWLTALLLALALTVLLVRIVREPARRNTMIDALLLSFVLAYGLLHWLVAFNTYDRYLLPLLLPLALLAARGLDGLLGRVPIWQAAFAYGLLAVLLWMPALHTAEGDSAINSDHRLYSGIDQLADYLNTKPVATVLYDRWLGWELGYYLGQWHDKRVVYYPTPDLLVRDALALCEVGPRYFPAPANEPIGRWQQALQNAGFGFDRDYAVAHFVVYRITPPWSDSSACLPSG